MLLHKIRHYLLFGSFPILLICRIKISGENIYHSERQFYCYHILHELKKVLAHTKTCWTWTRKNNLRFQTRIFFIGIFQLWGMGLPGGEYSVIPAHYSDSEPTNLCSLFLNAACLMEKQKIPIL